MVWPTNDDEPRSPGIPGVDALRETWHALRERLKSRTSDLFDQGVRRPYANMMRDWLATDFEMFEWVCVEVRDCDDCIVVDAGLPSGFTVDDLEIACDGNELYLRGMVERDEEAEESGDVIYSEFERRSLFRKVSIPGSVDADDMRTECNGTILRITLPKTESRRVAAE